MNRNLWHRLSTFFENGDLTPFAVIISIAHYGPVLASHGENVLVAWLVGTTIDLIHFRTVRRLFQVRGRKRVIGHAFVAVLTTLMALGYHLRFYGNDLLLAAPIPLGIAILAQHAAAKSEHDHTKKWRNRVKTVMAIAKKAGKRADEFEVRNSVLSAQVEKLTAEINRTKTAIPHPLNGNLPHKKPQLAAKANGKAPVSWRQLSDNQRKQLAGMTPDELATSYPKLSDRTRRLWAQRAREFSSNGHAK